VRYVSVRPPPKFTLLVLQLWRLDPLNGYGPIVLLLNDPNRGVDVGAKAEIYHLCAELAAGGMALLFTSSVGMPDLSPANPSRYE
jgi:hypothetical protein